jgi:SAM-dependent methyltransferase
MDATRGTDQDGPPQTDPTANFRSGSVVTHRAGPQGEAIFAYLAKEPDIAGLMREYPQLTVDDLRAYFAEARSLLQEATTVTFKKGANRTVFARTHGLPAPDPSIHKGNIFRALLALLKPGKMLDLGAGKGNFSLSAAQLGWKVTAVDARTVRWPDADAAPDPAIADLIRTIRWVQADVREFPIEEGEYDLVCVLGLLHHLEVSDQVSLLKRCSTMPTLLDTRIAKALVDVNGPYEGMLIREHGETRKERDAVPQASWGNPLSFQHTEESLLRLALDCGYMKMMQMRPPHRADYTFYLCLPSSSNGSIERRARREERRARKNETA